MDDVKESINRARRKLKTLDNNENFISIKIKPDNGGCCCFHCWPMTWEEINNVISDYGHIEDEGDLEIGDKDDRFVLECHESGPEIVLLTIGIASTNLITSIINLILTIVKSRQREKMGAQFKITKRVIKNSKIIEENVMELDFPISKENVTLLNKKIKDILKRNNN